MKLTDPLTDKVVIGFLDPGADWQYCKMVDIGDCYIMAVLVRGEWIPSLTMAYPKSSPLTLGELMDDAKAIKYRIVRYDYAK